MAHPPIVAVAILAIIIIPIAIGIIARAAGTHTKATRAGADAAAHTQAYFAHIAKEFASKYWQYYAVQILLIVITVPIAVVLTAKVSANFTDAQASKKLPWANKRRAWLILVAVLLVSFLLRTVRTTLREMIIPRATSLISAALFDRYLRNVEAATTEADEGVGDVLYTMRQVTEDISWIVVVWTTDVVSIAVMLAVLSIYLASVSIKLGLIGLAFSAVVIVVGALYNIHIVQKVIEFMNAERDIMARGEQYVVNAATIAAYSARADIGPDLAGFTERLVKQRTAFTRAETSFNGAWRTLMLLFFAFVAYACLKASRNVSRNRMQTIITVLFLMLYWLLDLGADLVDMAWRFASVLNPYAMRLFNTSPEAAADEDRQQTMDVPAGAILQMRDVGFMYPAAQEPAEREEEGEDGATAKTANGGRSSLAPRPWAIQPFSLTASPGERIVIKGGSGSGKSTLFKLLAAFETPTQGEIRLGNGTSTDVARRTWRQHVLLVSQKWALFEGSILENMAIATGVHGVTPDQMNAYLRRYQLQEIIADVDQQVGSSAATGGGQMSGGMGKVIALARAALRIMPDQAFEAHFPGATRANPRPQVVLFDEPLAALDQESRAKVLRMITDIVTGPCITLYIMHNDDLDQHASRVIHIAEGKLEAQTLASSTPIKERSGNALKVKLGTI
jgi:ABC-type multidrug transport system fused ATPase/permease subunit